MLASKGLMASSAAEPIYVDDVFSTYLYTGNGTTRTITNGIDLAGEGGLVWLKERTAIGGSQNHQLSDTARGASKRIFTNLTNAEDSSSTISSFNSSGFSLSTSIGANNSGSTYASWTFRKAPKFFDVVTYTGNGDGGGQNIPHSLDAKPAFIIVKRTNATQNWFCLARKNNTSYFTSASGTNDFGLNTTAAGFEFSDQSYATTTTFNPLYMDVGNNNANINGATYVAYLFAHDAGGFGESGTDNAVSCGSYTGNGSASGPIVTLGYEPQYVVIKRADDLGNWNVSDSLRGIPTGNASQLLQFNLSEAESTGTSVSLLPTGFQVITTSSSANASGGTYIYLAIRRPNKPPTSGTEVYYAEAIAQADTIDSTGVPFPPDLVNTFSRNGTNRSENYMFFQFVDRLRGLGTPNNTFSTDGKGLVSSSTVGEYNDPFVQLKADSRNITRTSGWNSAGYGNWINYFFKRAPGFFDVVCYTGTSVASTVAHNLTVAPELMIVKCRSNSSTLWRVYHSALGATKYINLNGNEVAGTFSGFWNNTAPTTTTFTVGTDTDVNGSARTFVSYLFATLAGISKVGSYTGTGTTQQINCGFTTGARFVLIKRTDSTGDWYVWDTARGIIAGNDPYLLLNSTAAEVTSTDYIDPLASGFEISSTAPAEINASGGSFIYLAVA